MVTDNSVLVYGAGIQYKTVIYQAKLLGQLEAKDKEPFLVFSGLGCDECDINRSIYIHSPSDPAIESGERATRYSHPGKYYEDDGKTLYEVVRMFVGACLPEKKERCHLALKHQSRQMEMGEKYFCSTSP